ncbi:unnamed protein product [Rotaria sp. Silwood2]|nr:unnamed protein product [Rotaria sp. Silwood2]
MGDHLMMCGNKTDQCPNCRQFVRRAIFAYHYENNCANPDAPTADSETNQNTQNSTRSNQFNKSDDNELIPCEYCSQGISWRLYDNHTAQVNDGRRLISCSFCNEHFTSTKEMGDHLLMCGNKTDPCPNCKKFIRRAIFAYHYENSCADVNAIDTDVNSTAHNSVASSASQPNISSQSSTGSASGHNKHITTMAVDLRTLPNQDSTTFQQSSSGRL